jgi:signal transduction protein with GAF and PtsI domain
MPNRNGGDMPRKRKKPPAAQPGAVRRHQFNVGLMPDTAARVEDVAAALGLDPTVLIRTIVHEQLPVYEERAAKARRAPPT